MQLIIISGRSGSGKSVALDMLEDLGYYCVDGLPLTLLPDVIHQIKSPYQKLSVSLDARNIPDQPELLKKIIDEIETLCESHKIIFLDAEDSILLKRFSVTRRKHPLTNDITSLNEALINEQQLLRPLGQLAHITIDTHHLSVHQLRTKIREYVTQNAKPKLTILLQSFSYKSGIPAESDFVFDVRCLPNPYWQTELRHHTGIDENIQAFFEDFPSVNRMMTSITEFIQDWIPFFESDSRQYLTIAIGCTGGQHRSVYITEKIANNLRSENQPIQIRHRDLP